MKRSCFTLIELLVVVAIIGILASMLVPTLNKAKQKAAQVACTSSMRGQGLLIQQYAADQNDKYPRLIGSGVTYELIQSGIIDSSLSIFKCKGATTGKPAQSIKIWGVQNNGNGSKSSGSKYSFGTIRIFTANTVTKAPKASDKIAANWLQQNDIAGTNQKQAPGEGRIDFIYLGWLAQVRSRVAVNSTSLPWDKMAMSNGFNSNNANAGIAMIHDLDTSLGLYFDRSANHKAYGNVLYGDCHVSGHIGGGSDWLATNNHHGWGTKGKNEYFQTLKLLMPKIATMRKNLTSPKISGKVSAAVYDKIFKKK